MNYSELVEKFPNVNTFGQNMLDSILDDMMLVIPDEDSVFQDYFFVNDIYEFEDDDGYFTVTADLHVYFLVEYLDENCHVKTSKMDQVELLRFADLNIRSLVYDDPTVFEHKPQCKGFEWQMVKATKPNFQKNQFLVTMKRDSIYHVARND